jgi:hypothetical protein
MCMNADVLTLQSSSVYRYKRNVATLGFSCVETKNKGVNTLAMVSAVCCNGVIVFGVFRVHCSCLILEEITKRRYLAVPRGALGIYYRTRTHPYMSRRTDRLTHTHTYEQTDRRTHSSISAHTRTYFYTLSSSQLYPLPPYYPNPIPMTHSSHYLHIYTNLFFQT